VARMVADPAGAVRQFKWRRPDSDRRMPTSWARALPNIARSTDCLKGLWEVAYGAFG